jgi:hypothetical protein
LKYIITKAITVLLVLCVAQLIGAKAQAIELNESAVMVLNVEVENAEALDLPINPVFPANNNEMDEHLEYEQVSEKEMLPAKKNQAFSLLIQPSQKANKTHTQKPSNESMGILSPPPKA